SIPADSTKTNESKVEKKAESSQRAGTSKQPRDKTAASKSNNPEPGNLPEPGHEPDRNPDRRGNPGFQPPPQNQPSFDPLRAPRGRQPGHPPSAGEITTRTLPNG